ncbi:hypothetical protein [Bradyrhizobium sp. CB3481]|uniref:hypothetical protein n=1 Tax=Bradyrhizobium sp. CB3481 TaxID=3039158 RepID=UPI0024B094DE|nr:hypothetical protein [Bradyrhizobium sp. CB3481]WFU14485.1 hypothetical protein QA643_25305 [Bradyrhizobium sp. CB3481]
MSRIDFAPKHLRGYCRSGRGSDVAERGQLFSKFPRAIVVELKRDEDMRRLTVITKTERGVC